MKNPWDQIDPPLNDVSARRVDHTHDLDLFWARDHLGHYLFVYEMAPEEAPDKVELPNLVGIQTAYVLAGSDSYKTRLVLVLNEKSNWELFLALCNDLVQATRLSEGASSAVHTIIRRLARWQDFLKKHRSELLTERQIKGLIGELIFLKSHLTPRFGIGMAVQFWQGPEGLPQDFNVNKCAIEVKCKLGATAPYVTITSADQLCPQLPEIYLFVVTLGKATPETSNAVNLPNLVSTIRSALQSENSSKIERFNDLLYLAGYLDSDRYLEFSYILADETMYKVVDGFPRICSDEIHSGIIKLSYDVRLSECDPYVGRPNWMGEVP